ncbi:hypothetical protein RRG08_060327 [Elysia crispata]|uniref:Uncharacterized protein n=1 Tax=Elysia crispata TaxID=231223 RepID=A0AAE1E0A7_9GAST|nr:hypothetical protein RRG08_060327 [Elysia crispata]
MKIFKEKNYDGARYEKVQTLLTRRRSLFLTLAVVTYHVIFTIVLYSDTGPPYDTHLPKLSFYYFVLEDLTNLTHLTMVIKETMRFHSPVHFFHGVLSKDTVIDRKIAPAGTAFNLHHNPLLWPKSMVKVQSRSPSFCTSPLSPSTGTLLALSVFLTSILEFKSIWSTKRCLILSGLFQSDSSKVILTSSPQPPAPCCCRICLGKNFAINEIKILLARILHRITVRLDPDHKDEKCERMVIKAKDDIRLLVSAR